MAKCIIFGALPVDKSIIKIHNDDFVIAADAGLNTLNEYGISPNLILGDFDSFQGIIPTGDNVILHPTKKDDTDTILAIKEGLNKGFKEFIIYGCLGGRLDHTFANIQAACFVAENGGNAVLINNETYLTVLKDSSIDFSSDCSGNISVFAVSEEATGVTEANLLYELNNATLSPDFPLGISNEFIGKNATVSVEKGKLCIIWDNTDSSYKIGGLK